MKKREKLLQIFDLDDVISLGGLSKKKLEYESKLYPWLYKLRNKGCILILLTHNLEPEKVLEGLSEDFKSLFTEIYSPVKISETQYRCLREKVVETPNTYRWYNGSCYIQSPKDITIKFILKKYNIKASQAIFYDDFDVNINAVKRIRGITTVLVDPITGILIDN